MCKNMYTKCMKIRKTIFYDISIHNLINLTIKIKERIDSKHHLQGCTTLSTLQHTCSNNQNVFLA